MRQKSIRLSAVKCDRQRFASQDKSYSHHKKSKLGNLTNKIFQTSINCRQGIHPRVFCRRWFDLETTNENGRPRFTEEQILAMESEYGYREKCINLIAELLKVKPNTVHHWGKGVSFDKISADKRQKYETYLGYIDTIRVMTMNLGKLDKASLSRLLRQLEARK